MDSSVSPAQSAPVCSSSVPPAQPVLRKLVRKAIGNPSPSSGRAVLTSGTSRSASVDISAVYQHGSQLHAPELHRSSTAASAVSSDRDRVFSNNAPLSPLTNVTTYSPVVSPSQSDNPLSLGSAVQEVPPLSSPLAVCVGCTGAIQPTNIVIRCLVCSSANQVGITSLCLHCYESRTPRTGHNHDTSFFGCDSDPIVQQNKFSPEIWTVRRNSSSRMWYEHRSSGFKTWITPMTAVVVLPPGWVHMRDPQGNLYYQNNITRETTRIPPANLPPGWIESKDPDGKLFFVNHELQLASWCRPGHQPPLAASTAATNSAVISNNQAARPALADIPATSNMHPQPIVMAPKPNVQGQRSVAGPRLGQQQVSLAAATEATINLLDPSNGGIVRNTKIVSHIAGQSVKGTVKAVAQNQRLQTFARGTGIAMANKKVKKAWRKAAKEVASLDGHRKQEIFVTQSGPQGKIAVQGANASFDGEYVIEYEDGTVEYYDAKQRLLRTSTIGSWPSHQQNPKLMHRHANQQRPPLQTQSHPVQGQQLLLQPAQQQTQSSQSQSQQGSMQQGQLQQSQFQQPLLQASDLPQGSPQQVRIQNYQTLQAQPQPSQPQQGPIQQFQSQPQAQQIQTYHSQLQQSVQGQLQQAVQGQLQQALQSQLQPDQPQQAQTSQTQNQFQAQQNQSLMDQLQQAAQDQVYQAVQQQLTQKQAAQAQQSQSQPQSHAQQTQSILQQQQDQNQQMQQLLQQSKLQAQQNFNQQLQQQLQRQQQQQTASEPPYAQTQPSLLDQAISVFQESTQQQPQSVSIDQAPAQTVYMDQSLAQAIYIDQNYQDRSYGVQGETIPVEDGSCDQVYELQDDGCVDGSYEIDTGDCGGFDDASFDL